MLYFLHVEKTVFNLLKFDTNYFDLYCRSTPRYDMSDTNIYQIYLKLVACM